MRRRITRRPILKRALLPRRKFRPAAPSPCSRDSNSITRIWRNRFPFSRNSRRWSFIPRANIETLAKLSLTIEDELKQKEFAEPIGQLYSVQDRFHAKIASLIESYQAKCESLKQAA